MFLTKKIFSLISPTYIFFTHSEDVLFIKKTNFPFLSDTLSLHRPTHCQLQIIPLAFNNISSQHANSFSLQPFLITFFVRFCFTDVSHHRRSSSCAVQPLCTNDILSALFL